MPERMRRVNLALKEVVSDAIADLKDPRIGFVTVTSVQATNDLAQATVYVSVLGTARRQRETVERLSAARGVIQARVNQELHLRRTPRLAFAYDPSVERGVRLSKLLDELAPQGDESDRGGDHES
jgi:ribosome-binding factor A